MYRILACLFPRHWRNHILKDGFIPSFIPALPPFLLLLLDVGTAGGSEVLPRKTFAKLFAIWCVLEAFCANLSTSVLSLRGTKPFYFSVPVGNKMMPIHMSITSSSETAYFISRFSQQFFVQIRLPSYSDPVMQYKFAICQSTNTIAHAISITSLKRIKKLLVRRTVMCRHEETPPIFSSLCCRPSACHLSVVCP